MHSGWHCTSTIQPASAAGGDAGPFHGFHDAIERVGGAAFEDALVKAGTIRPRPILMTTLCTLFGPFPLAVGIGLGAELQKPQALAVVSGLSLSTFITLRMVPVFYSLTEPRQHAV
jgi:multidrug efflux pump subunit AcrB